ncbi:MAG TPA: lipocalin-like domain-containing protein [Ideonella sp.]|nr:lipocalin-like domain-containing protein [Ideonella sp.]
MRRRALLVALAAGRAAPAFALAPRALVFPADFGAHPDAGIEWWYVTGSLGDDHGFQITFFRSRTDVAADAPSRFAAKQLVFAHAAVTDLAGRRLRHDQRVAREGFGLAYAREGTTDVRLHDWTLARRADGTYRASAASEAAGFAFRLDFGPTQPVLLQGDAGWSRKGPRPTEASEYYSEPQLRVAGTLALDGRERTVEGRAWLDHEWSDSVLPEGAVGWDWIGMNLDDGAALTAFRLRREDGTSLWAGGSSRAGATSPVRAFAPEDVRFEPLRHWRSPASRANYPVEWRVATPGGTFTVRARLDAQELDSRASTGAIYWEGLSDLLDARGQRVGRGYLEMTGYALALALR